MFLKKTKNNNKALTKNMYKKTLKKRRKFGGTIGTNVDAFLSRFTSIANTTLGQNNDFYVGQSVEILNNTNTTNTTNTKKWESGIITKIETDANNENKSYTVKLTKTDKEITVPEKTDNIINIRVPKILAQTNITTNITKNKKTNMLNTNTQITTNTKQTLTNAAKHVAGWFNNIIYETADIPISSKTTNIILPTENIKDDDYIKKLY